MGTTGTVITGATTATGASGPTPSGLLGGAPPGATSNSPKEDVTLTVDNQNVAGWTTVRITRGIERLPSDFDIRLTEKYPGAVRNVIVQPGMLCVVKIGNDVVLTGYIDKYVPEIDGDNHIIQITGRSKCQDLVDCSALWPSGQIASTDALDIATKLAKPYGIKVNTLSSQGDLFPLPKVPQQMYVYSESAVDIIARSCRASGLLFYDDVNGNLVLAQVGNTKAGCGFQEGINVQRARGTFTMDQRFSYMMVRLQALAFLSDVSNKGSVLFPASGEPNVTYNSKGINNLSSSSAAGKTDSGVIRFRNKNLICEYPLTTTQAGVYMEQLWNWEKNRRYGRSFRADITTDSWRDSAGTLWTPNTLIDIAIPSIRMLNKVTYVISEVTYMRDDENGTTCQIVAMPPQAFTVQPIVLTPVQPDVGSPEQVPGNAANTKTTQGPQSTTTTAISPASNATATPTLVGPSQPSSANQQILQIFDPKE